MRTHVTGAVFRKNFRASFSNPTAYVFITIFIVTCSVFQFSWGDLFFRENLAELGPLNNSFPFLLLFFIPVLTMNSWAEERKLGTEEFMLTLPATDFEVILGKYFALLATYAASLGFSLTLVFVLSSLGNPDLGLIFANYLAYLLTGAAMLSIGVVASMLTSNSTIAFIIGVLFNAIFMYLGHIAAVVSTAGFSGLGSFLENIGFGEKSGILSQFDELSSGVITLPGVVYLLSVTAVMLYLSMVLVGRRHWAHGSRGTSLTWHYTARVATLIIALTALNVILARTGSRADLTSEQVHSFSPVSAKLMAELEKPVLIEAYVSKKVPENVIENRKNLLSTLREIEATSKGNVKVLIHETEPRSKEAADAEDRYSIVPRTMQELSNGAASVMEVFMGIAVTSGANQEVIPFLDLGLSAEYELVRSIRVVSKSDRRKVGILKTQVNINGGMDFQRRQPIPAWEVVQELRKQYEIVEVSADSDYPSDLDLLLAVLPSTLAQPQMDRLQTYMLSGKKTMLMCDALPVDMVHMSPAQRHMPASDPRMGGGGAAGAVKGNIGKLLSDVGVSFKPNEIVWSSSNPYPTFEKLPQEITFSQAANNEFSQDTDMSSGLQVVLSMFPGHLKKVNDNSWISFSPIYEVSSRNHGTINWSQLVSNNYMGAQVNPEHRYQHLRQSTEDSLVLAAHVKGSRTIDAVKDKDGKETSPEKKESVDLIVFSDIDLISDRFFSIRREGWQNLTLDNVTLFLNAIDSLTGDKDFVELRKKRKNHRTLTKFDLIRSELDAQRRQIIKKAEADATLELAKAQESLNKAVTAVQNREDIKDEEKLRILATVQEAQNQAFSNKQDEINKRKERKIQDEERKMEEAMKSHRRQVVVMAVILPPLLPLFIGLFVYFKRRSREMNNVSSNRIKENV
ncbi:MAG: Gldg family protein [Lentisphaeraceae bacterium]|nr:Gldg family protein [Lentisphaeraceae bacterium]